MLSVFYAFDNASTGILVLACINVQKRFSIVDYCICFVLTSLISILLMIMTGIIITIKMNLIT
jgi:hypothetical protein